MKEACFTNEMLAVKSQHFMKHCLSQKSTVYEAFGCSQKLEPIPLWLYSLAGRGYTHSYSYNSAEHVVTELNRILSEFVYKLSACCYLFQF